MRQKEGDWCHVSDAAGVSEWVHSSDVVSLASAKSMKRMLNVRTTFHCDSIIALHASLI